MLTIAKSILFAKFTTINPSLFLVAAPYLPIISSSPMFFSPTCPFRSASRIILSCFNTLSINLSRSSQTSFFSSMLLLTCGVYAVTMSLHPPPIFLALLPFNFVSYRHYISIFLRSIISASSFLLPVIVPIFKAPTLTSERLPFHSSRCLFTRPPPLFLLLFSLCLAVA